MTDKLIESFPEKIKDAYQLEVPHLKNHFNRIVVVGMGGSYIDGLVLKELLNREIKIPIEVYPGGDFLVNKNTLYILISYGGNTKEVLQAFRKVKRHNFLVLTSGGKLLRLAKKQAVELPSKVHQRFTFAYGLFPILRVLENLNMIENKKKLINKIIKTLEKSKKSLKKDAKLLALRLKNKTPLFYSSNYFYPAAYRLQTAIEEDAKIICHANRITEIFHNEIEALPSKEFLPILILDKIPGFKKQIKYLKKLIKDFYDFKYEGVSKEERMFLIFYFADFLGYYLSRIKRTPMGSTPLSDEIKKR